MVHTEHVPRWQQHHMGPAMQQLNTTVHTPMGWIFTALQKNLRHECSESAQEQRITLYGSDQQQFTQIMLKGT